MGELATMMHCHNLSMTGIVDRLEERGLVPRWWRRKGTPG